MWNVCCCCMRACVYGWMGCVCVCRCALLRVCCVVTLGGVVLRWVSGSSTCTKKKKKRKEKEQKKRTKKRKSVVEK